MERELNCYAIGQRVKFSQVKHVVPFVESKGGIEIHESPRSGVGVIQSLVRHHDAWTLFVLPDGEKGKMEMVVLLLRVPPDSAEVI